MVIHDLKILRVPIFIWSEEKDKEQILYEILEQQNRFHDECLKTLFKEKSD